MAVSRAQGKGFNCVMAVAMAALVIVAAKTASDYRDAWVADTTRTATYLAAHSGPFCAFEGVWYDWDDDETITLGCLELKGNIREGSFTSTTGPRASSPSSISGKYDIDSDSFMRIVGKDQDGKAVKSTMMIYVEDPEYPTQMIVIDKKGEGGFYIWQGNRRPDG